MLTMMFDEMLYMNNIEIAPHNYGDGGRYKFVAGCLLAFACRMSQIKGKGYYKGFLIFESKTELMPLYENKYGATKAAGQRMFFSPEAADRIIGGIAGSSMEDSKNKKLIAYHEVGHAIVGSTLENHDEVEKITLIPRGGAKGLTWFAPEEDQTLVSRSQLLARIITTLGGRVAEKVVFGDPEITTGASNDLQQVTNIARQMVTRYGMSNIGPIALEDDNNEQMFLGGEYNEAIADRIDNEVCKIVNHCEQIATEIILDNRVIIDLVVEKLLDSETIDGAEFRKLVREYTILPSKN